MLIYKKQAPDIVDSKIAEAQEMVKQDKPIELVVTVGQISLRKYKVEIHARPGIKVGDSFLSDGVKVEVHAVITRGGIYSRSYSRW